MKVRFYPTANGTQGVAWTASAGDKWECVNDDPHNSDVDYVSCAPGAAGLYSARSVWGVLAGSLIQKVEVIGTFKDMGASTPQVRLSVWIGAVRADSATWGTTNAYVETTKDFTATRPGGGSWSPADFLTSTFEFGIWRDGIGADDVRCTACYCDITYEVPGGFVCFVT